MKNYYELLGIDSEAIDKEIIDAYSSIIKKNTKEKDEEKYNILVKVYETLLDSNLRKEYDIELKYGERIDSHVKNADEYIKNKEYKKAIDEYNTILSIHKTSHTHIYKLIKILIKDNQLNKATIECSRLVSLKPNNYEYNLLMAEIYEKVEKYEKAKDYYITSYELNSDDTDLPVKVANMYMNIDKNSDAIIFLQKCIHKNKFAKLENIDFYKEIINIYTQLNNTISIGYVIDIIQSKVIHTVEDAFEVCSQFYELSCKFYESKDYEASEVILNRIKKMVDNVDLHIYLKKTNNTEFINSISKKSELAKEKASLHKLYYKLESDSLIIDDIKLIARYNLFEHKYKDKNELSLMKKQTRNRIEDEIKETPTFIMNNLRILQKDYEKLFNIEKKLYLKFLNEAEELDKFKEQYDSFISNFSIDNNVKNIIKLELDEELSIGEKSRDIKGCLQKIKSYDFEKKEEVHNSLINISQLYPKVYNVYEEGFNNLIKHLRPNKLSKLLKEISIISPNSNGNKNSSTNNIIMTLIALIFIGGLFAIGIFIGNNM